MIILGLDTASQTGWAVGSPGGDPTFGSFTLPKTGEDVGAFAMAYWQELSVIVKTHQPTIICYERPLFLAHTKTAFITTMKLMGLGVMTEFLGKAKGIRIFDAHQAEVKKHFTGRGRFTKERNVTYPPLQCCQDRGWMVGNTDEADACAIWDFACHHAAPELARVNDPLAKAAGGW